MSARADSLARLLERGRQQQQRQRGAAPNFLSASEAERMVKSLRPVAIHEFGTPAFLELHHTVEQLALQAHHNAATHSDEFVADLLASHGGRLGALVRGLLAAEAWREHVFAPHLRARLLAKSNKDGNGSAGCDPWVLYCALRHEAALASLLELCLFRATAAAAAPPSSSSSAPPPPPPLLLLLSDSEALELADWCVRRMRHLALLLPGAGGGGRDSRALSHPIARAGAWRRELMLRGAAEAAAAAKGDNGDNSDSDGDGDDGNGNASNKQQQARVRALAAAARALLDAPPELELDDRFVETEFQAALPALGLTRWLADAACCCGGGGGGEGHAPQSLAVLSRLVGRPSGANGDDAVTLLAQLLDRPPWERPVAPAAAPVAGAAPAAAFERYLSCGGSGSGASSSSSSSSSSWIPVAAGDRHVLAPHAAQAWLALCRLLCDPSGRARWLAGAGGGGGGGADPHCSSSLAAVLRLRRPLASPLLLDQAPFLVSLARVVEGLAMMAGGGGGGGGFASSALSSPMLTTMVEPLPGLRAAALAEAAKRAKSLSSWSSDWARALAESQARGAFSAARSREAAQARAASAAQAFEHYCLLAGGEEQQQQQQQEEDEEGEEERARRRPPRSKGAGAVGKGSRRDDDDTAVPADAATTTDAATAHVTCWRQAGCDMWEPWGDFVCRVDAARGAEEVAVGGGGETAAAASSASSAARGAAAPPPSRRPRVRGLRRRLLPVAAFARPLPCEGKVAVRVGDRVAEARLSLPPLHSRRDEGDDDDDDEGGNDNNNSNKKPPPPAVWVSVGDLARDGFVLQLRLARAPPAKRELDRSSGHWFAYAPAGAGALTVAAAAAAAAAGE